MKHIIILVIFYLSTLSIFAQSAQEGACGPYTPQTICDELSPPPLNPVTLDYGCFDWTVPMYRVAIKKQNGNANCVTDPVTLTEIRSPFYPMLCGVPNANPTEGQVNTSHFWEVSGSQVVGGSVIDRNNRDMFPSQGWVLLFDSFGRWTENKSSIHAVNYPVFVLYNKYTGITRVFLYDFCKIEGIIGVEISLFLLNDFDSKGTRIFDDSSPYALALDNIKPIQKKVINVTNILLDGGTWYMADFMTSFDPCSELKTSALDLHIGFRRLTSFNVDLKVNGTIVSNQNNTALDLENRSKKPISSSLIGDFDVNGIGKASVSAYKEFEGYKKSIVKYTEKLSLKNKNDLSSSYDKIISNQLKLDPNGIPSTEKLEKAIPNLAGNDNTTSSIHTALLGISNVLPYVGVAYGLYKHFTSNTTSIKSSPTISTVNLTITGTLSNEENSTDVKVRLPGTHRLDPGNGVSNYYRTLGLFKVLKTPKLSFFRYRLNNIDGTFKSYIESNWTPPTPFQIDIENGNRIYARQPSNFNGTVLTSPTNHYNGYALRQFYLNEPIKILVNNTVDDFENANIDVLSAEAAFVLEYDKNNIADLDKQSYILPRGYFPILPNYTTRNKKFTEICNEFGWFVETATENIEERNSIKDYELLRLRTKYLPLNIFEKQSFFLSWLTDIDEEFFIGSIPKAEIKLVVSYRPKDPNYIGPNLLFIRSFEVDLDKANENSDYVGDFGFKLADNPTQDYFEYDIQNSDGSLPRFVSARECLFANTEIEKITYNPLFPNRIGTYQKEPSANLELLSNNPYQVYTDERSLDIFDADLSLNENAPYNNLSSRLLFFNGSSTIISPFWKEWSNVIVASTGEFLAIRHPRISIPDGDFSIPSNFSQCSFSNSKTIIIDNAYNQTPINFSKCEFVASERVLLSGKIKLEAGSVIGNSKNPIFRSTPQYYLNGNIANQGEITDVCQSQEYTDAVSVLSVKPSDTFFGSDSSNYKNRIQPIDYSIFPNPANNTVTIQAPKSETVISGVVIKNLLGMEVQRFVIKNPSSEVTIDVSAIPVGLYILNVNNFSTRLGIQR